MNLARQNVQLTPFRWFERLLQGVHPARLLEVNGERHVSNDHEQDKAALARAIVSCLD